MRPNKKQSYNELLRYACRVTRRSDEAEDLLQSVLLAAVEAGRADMACVDNRRWLLGALRKRALFDARSAVRRRKRETSVAAANDSHAEGDVSTTDFVDALPRGLRTTALLALTGHTRQEIAWLLRVSDNALRQRIAQIKRRWRVSGGQSALVLSGLRGELDFGRIRQALLTSVGRDDVILASHDPDGHLFVVGSQKAH